MPAMRWEIRSAISVVLFLQCAGGCADKMMLHPSTGPADAGGAVRREVNDRGRTIEVFVAQSEGAKAAGSVGAYVLEFCGNATRAEWVCGYIARRWGERPVEVWVMNYPGFGGST